MDISHWWNRGKGRAGVFLLLAALAAVLASPRHGLAGATVEFDVSNNGASNITGGRANALYDAATGTPTTPSNIEDAIAAGPGGYTADVDISITGNQSAGVGTTSDIYAWTFHGGTNTTLAGGTYGTINGFNNFAIDGSATAGGRAVLTGRNTALGLKIVHVAGTLSVQNLTVQNARYATGNMGGAGSVYATEVGGGGMLLGGNGNKEAHTGPQTVVVKNVDAINNTIQLNSATSISNAFGGGILVNAHGLDAGGNLDGNRSDVTFENVNLTGNKITFTKADTLGASIRGGGARVAFGSKFTYAGGIVSNNSVWLKNGNHAAGGGLSVDDRADGSGAYTDVTLSAVTFTGNTVTTVDAAEDTSIIIGNKYISYARGGGFYFLGTLTAGTTNLTMDANTVFTGNKAVGEYTGGNAVTEVHAHGGAAFVMLDTAKMEITGATFSNNTAESARGDGAGGALALSLAGYSNIGSLTVAGANFSGNTASGSTGSGYAANSYGGAVFSTAGTGTGFVFTNTNFSRNTALTTGAGVGDAVGGAMYLGSGNHTITGGRYEWNSAENQGIGDAYGGAAYFGSGNQTLSGVTYANNSAVATNNGFAWGGALYFDSTTGNTSSTIKDATFSGNAAESDGGFAHGGAIYFNQGTLKITDSSLIGNRVVGDEAEGSAIFMNTDSTSAPSTDDVALTLEATAGKSVAVEKNSANGRVDQSGVYFGNSRGGNTWHNARLDITGAGDVSLLNPVKVEMDDGFDFTMTKDNTGSFKWDGVNSFQTLDNGTSTVNLKHGVIDTGSRLTVRGTGATSNFAVNLTGVEDIRLDIARNQNTALFDFANGGTRNMTIDGVTYLTADIGRAIKSFDDKEFLIVAGLTQAQANALISNGTSDGFLLRTDLSDYVGVKSGLYTKSDENLYAGISFKSPFEDNVNSFNAMDALDNMVNSDWGLANISDAEVRDMYRNANNITPELYMEQAFAMIHGVDVVSRAALNYGLRAPHRQRTAVATETYPVDNYDEYGGSYVDSYSAYPQLLDCTEARGYRAWVGYVGDWRKQDSHGGFNGYKLDRNGFVVGVNYDFGSMASVGGWGGYTKSKTRARGAGSEVVSDTGHLGLMGRFSPLTNDRGLSFYGELGYHWSDNDLTRTLGGWSAEGSFDQSVFTAGVGVEYVLCVGSVNLVPHFEGRYFSIDQDDLRETGTSSTAANVEGLDRSAFNTRMGVEVSKDYFMNDLVLSPTLSVDWRHDYGNRAYSGSAYYTADPTMTPLSVRSARMDRDSVDVGVALKGMKDWGTRKLGFNLSYNFNISRHSDTHTLYAGVDLGF